ncbi:hypothetical protein TVAG_015770 [Trichomonas vaginalis G3]|uniref:Palmitoyltransferase n=1 Tax=Trichomonas vaginalis (strain ATCC PRA-98 / G3) TaxID=412133 RepID=A2DP48_TRIV3|nr:DHHC palmitoyltransferase family [Trichomonas vaginalis G3]EAY17748.1 hypothetical protein TVAG_015770 [Trichomonas vaginalis G3]KAI5484227.1 DHHC palmitoyltransferase family [Trichomonas vaginalis G3]|eukprot:XP_001329883.1 hypothetical protein [Trichomonas vaginalis G3]
MLAILVDTSNALVFKNLKGLDKQCPRCQAPIGCRSIHCEVCDKCSLRHYLHSDYLSTCVASTNSDIALQFLGLGIVIEIFHVVVSTYPLFHKSSPITWIQYHIFLIPSVFFSLHSLIQLSIILYQLVVIACKNSLSIKTHHTKLFEYYELLPDEINPFNYGLIENLSAFMQRGDMNEDVAKELPHYEEFKKEISKISNFVPTEPLL